MSKQNFEKHVQEKMEEFNLVPSPPVWDKIEEQIGKKKERRRVLLWILPLLLITGVGGFWLIQEQENAITKAPSKTSVPVNHNKSQEEITTSEKSAKNQINSKLDRAPGQEKFNTSVFSSSSIRTQSTIIKREDVPAINDRSPASQQNKKVVIDTISKQIIAVIEPAQTTSENQHITRTETKQLSTEKLIDIESVKSESTPVVDEIAEQVNAMSFINKEKKNQLVFTLKTGISGTAKNLGDVIQERTARDNFPASQTSGPQPRLSPSSAKNDLSFSIGAGLKRNINSRAFITSGINVSYYSTRIQVGSYIRDTVVSFANYSRQLSSSYRNDVRLTGYRNKYVFIELPVSFNYQVFRNIPLHWNSGATVGRLLYSNALHYNKDANIYFKDNNRINKTQFSLFTGFDYQVLRSKNFSLQLGPQMQYGVTPLQKKTSDPKQHLFSIGVNTRVSF